MNVTQEMIEDVEKQIKTLWYVIPDETLPLRMAKYETIDALGRLKEAYKRILELESEVEDLWKKILNC